MLTNYEYTKIYGGRLCPLCASEYIKYTSEPEVNADEIWFNMSCLNCNACWLKYYKVNRYSDLHNKNHIEII